MTIKLLQDALASAGFSEEESQSLLLRYGLVDGSTRTMDEVSRLSSLSREAVRALESRLLKVLKERDLM